MSTHIAIALVAVLLIAALLPGLIFLRMVVRLRHRLEQHERALAVLTSARRPPPDGGSSRRLRLVAVWLPLVGAAGWLASRIHPAVGAALALTAATATVATLVVVAPHTDNVGLPPARPHRGSRTYSQQPQDRAPPLGTSRLSASSARPPTRPVLPPQSPPEPPSRFPVPSMLPTAGPPTTGSTLPLPTIPPPTITTTVQVPPRQPLLCLDVGLPLATVALDLGDCTSGED